MERTTQSNKIESNGEKFTFVFEYSTLKISQLVLLTYEKDFSPVTTVLSWAVPRQLPVLLGRASSLSDIPPPSYPALSLTMPRPPAPWLGGPPGEEDGTEKERHGRLVNSSTYTPVHGCILPLYTMVCVCIYVPIVRGGGSESLRNIDRGGI